jgi:protein-L-isoaspartate(D-aspartate) O-methyltransferase
LAFSVRRFYKSADCKGFGLMDFAEARKRMVDGQLRPNRVVDPTVLAAFRDLPRERFLPAPLRSRAYADEDVALPGGRALLEPLVIARLVQLAEIRPGDRALVVGAGSGYGATVVARCGARVVALEEEPALIALGRDATAGLLPAGALRFEQGRLTSGWSAGAPYDAILIEGEVPELPPAIEAQLAEGGRLVTVVGGGRRNGRAVLARRLGGTVSTSAAFDCATVALPAFQPAPGFVF